MGILFVISIERVLLHKCDVVGGDLHIVGLDAWNHHRSAHVFGIRSSEFSECPVLIIIFLVLRVVVACLVLMCPSSPLGFEISPLSCKSIPIGGDTSFSLISDRNGLWSKRWLIHGVARARVRLVAELWICVKPSSEDNLNEVPKFNWRGATLASLYRALDRAAMCFKTVTGPWMLLLFWAWSYLPVCRPTVAPITDLGQPSIDSCVPFGRDGTSRITCWVSSTALIEMMKIICTVGPERISRPPTRGETLECYGHPEVFQVVMEIRWLRKAYTPRGDRVTHLTERPTPDQSEAGNSALKNALHALGLVVRKGCRRVGKAILTNCRAQLEDASMLFRMEDLLEQRRLATKIEEIPDSEDESSSGHPTVPTNLQAEGIVQPDGRLNTG
ncbi:hypothetical protein LUZ63_009405 [Rhynchospora breviuscula]|uniref:Uncharacterized protein n=1 Tax=Rhynchospora breviuscula TaxID=2022672 RepID=A0A9Q0CFE0_9POAL|nr:hypothetical protein LUZ63_009405 [Rhynchospora breviuscula]